MKKMRIGGLILGTGVVGCALACAAPLFGLGALGLAADLEWAGIALVLLGAVVVAGTLLHRRSTGCSGGDGGTDAC